MSVGRKILVVSILTLAGFGLLAWITNQTVAGTIGALFFGVATLLTKETRIVLGIDRTRPPGGGAAATGAPVNTPGWKAMLSWFFGKIRGGASYIEFSFLIVAAIFVASVLYDSLLVSIADLVGKGFIVFNEDGFFHLQVYLFGFSILAVFIVFSAVYGFNQGASVGNAGFSGIFFASIIGFFAAIAILMIVRGDVVVENQALVSEVHGKNLPMGAALLRYAVQAGAALLFSFVLSLYVWVWVQFGRVAVWWLRKVQVDNGGRFAESPVPKAGLGPSVLVPVKRVTALFINRVDQDPRLGAISLIGVFERRSQASCKTPSRSRWASASSGPVPPPP